MNAAVHVPRPSRTPSAPGPVPPPSVGGRRGRGARRRDRRRAPTGVRRLGAAVLALALCGALSPVAPGAAVADGSDATPLTRPDVTPGRVVTSGALTPPTDLVDAVALASTDAPGHDSALALRADGTVVGWGDDGHGQTSVPDGLTGVVAVDTAGGSSLAVRSDGGVVAWGDPGSGVTAVPDDLGPVTAVAVGGRLTDDTACSVAYAVRADTTVVRWGGAASATCPGLGDEYDVPEGLAGIRAVSAGDTVVLALRDDGTVVRWGPGLAAADGVDPATWQDMTSVSAKGEHAVGVDASGRLVGWGVWGEAGAPTLEGVRAASAGRQVAALRDDGSVACLPGCATPPGAPRFQAVSGGSDQVLAVLAPRSDLPPAPSAGPGPVQLLPGYVGPDYAMNPPAGLRDAVELDATSFAAGGNTAMAVRSDGTVVGWGSRYPVRLQPPAGLSDVVDVGVGAGFALALRADGSLVPWGSGSVTTLPPDLGPVVAVDAGGTQKAVRDPDGGPPTVTTCGVALALRADGTVRTWGSTGATCRALTEAMAAPADLTDVVSVSIGDEYAVVARADGSVVGWGPSWRSYSTGLALERWESVTSVSTDRARIIGVRADGTVRLWGVTGEVPVGPLDAPVVAASAAQTSGFLLGPYGRLVLSGGPTGEQQGRYTAVAGGDNYTLAIAVGGSAAAPAVPPLGATTVTTRRIGMAAGVATAFRYPANRADPVWRARVFVDRSTTARGLRVGIYADDDGRPGALLSTASTDSVVPGAWNTVLLDRGVTVQAAGSYWLVALAPYAGADDGSTAAPRLVLRGADGAPPGTPSLVSADRTLTGLPGAAPTDPDDPGADPATTWREGRTPDSGPASFFALT